MRGEFLTFGWAGATIYGALQRRLQVNEHLFFGVETKLTASMAWIPVAEGSARVPNVALHLQGSLGLGF